MSTRQRFQLSPMHNRRRHSDLLNEESSDVCQRSKDPFAYNPSKKLRRWKGLDSFSSQWYLSISAVFCLEFLVYYYLRTSHIAISLLKTSAPPKGNKSIIHQWLYDNETERNLTSDGSITFQPTKVQKGWRVKTARKDSHKNSYFWKTHVPDPIPPLPPDIDSKTGEKLPLVVAYVVTLTKCSPKSKRSLDGAAILLHSIRRNSYGWVSMESNDAEISELSSGMWPKFGGQGGRYRFRAYVIVDADASPDDPSRKGDCARFLKKLGYTVLHRSPLVPLFEISNEFYDMDGGNEYFKEYRNQGYVGKLRSLDGPLARGRDENPDKLRTMIFHSGCCGYRESLKLHIYNFVEHELAVLLDFDSLLLRPMDDLFDVMLGKFIGDDQSNTLPLAKLPKSRIPDFSKPIDAAFTRDYNSVRTPSLNAPVGYQGGFLVVRPSSTVFERYRTILKRGEFVLNRTGYGWGGKHGGFYGDLTFQGLLPYYYEDVAPEGEHNEIELDRCIYNQMADNPRVSTFVFPRATPLDPNIMGFKDTKKCRDGRKDCSDTDCQRVSPKESISAHYTFCGKPWDCPSGNPGTVVAKTCLVLLREWFSVRRELEDWWLTSPQSSGMTSYRKNSTRSLVHKQHEHALKDDVYLGYCSGVDHSRYYEQLIEPETT